MEPVESKSRKHFYVSIAKSLIRVVACLFLINGDLVISGLLLIGAEGLGIVEEL